MLPKTLADSKTLEYIEKRNASIIDTHTFWAVGHEAQKTAWRILSPGKLNSCLRSLRIYGLGIPMVISQNRISAKIVNNFDNIVAAYLHYNPNPVYSEQLGYIEPDELDSLADGEHVVAFKTFPALSRVPTDSRKNDSFYEISIKHNLPVLIHCSGSGNEFSSINQFQNVLERYPNLKIIMAHFGGLKIEYMKDAVGLAENHPNIFLNTTSLNPFRSHPRASNTKYEAEEIVPPSKDFFSDIIDIFFDAAKRIPDQIIFGTDLGIFRIEAYSLWPIYELNDKRLESKILLENPLQVFSKLKLPKINK